MPDFLAAGPRDVLVPASGAEVEREMLLLPEPAAPFRFTEPARAGKLFAVGLVIGLALIACFAWLAAAMLV